MATRLYFGQTAATVSPAFDASWGTTAAATRFTMNHIKGTSAITEGTEIAMASGSHGLDRQYISHPLEAGSLTSSTLKVQLMCRQFGGGGIEHLLGTVYVVSGDGDTKGDIHFGFATYGLQTAYIINATHRNKTGWDGDLGGNVTINEGDRLVIELGHFCNEFDADPSAAAKWGEDGTDLPEDETQTTDGAGWVEFSDDLTFLPLAVAAAGTNIAAIRKALNRRNRR